MPGNQGLIPRRRKAFYLAPVLATAGNIKIWRYTYGNRRERRLFGLFTEAPRFPEITMKRAHTKVVFAIRLVFPGSSEFVDSVLASFRRERLRRPTNRGNSSKMLFRRL